jgi:hypothetical protein
MNFVHRAILIAFIVVAFHASILAYGPPGHEIVGAIADERLANTPTARKVYALLDGLTLEKAALIADEIKGQSWLASCRFTGENPVVEKCEPLSNV